MTTADKIAALPRMDDPGIHSREREKALRARLSLVLEVLDGEMYASCSCIPAYKDRGLQDPTCVYCDQEDARAVLEAMKGLR